jgi:N-acetylneuraminic acid mutarotase
VGVAALGSRLFVVGGFGAGPESSTVTAFDTKTQTWALLSPLPGSFQMPNVAAAGGKLYLLGALDVNTTLEYDPAADKWTPRAPVPVERGRGQSAVGVWGNKIIIAGGVIPGRSANGLPTGKRQHEVLAYDTTTDKWETFPDLALTRGYCMGAVIGDRFWVMGGSSDFARTDDVTVLDLKARAWMDQPMLPISLSSAAVTVLNGWVYLLGGVATSTGTIGPATLILDPGAGAFLNAEVMITPRFGMGAAAIDGRIYVPAGIAADPDPKVMFKAVPTLEVFIP